MAFTGSTATMALGLATVVLLAAVFGLGRYLGRRPPEKASPHAVSRRLPLQWPLIPRPLLNSNERRVWHWLRKVFPELHVMVKLPVTRFTMPRQPGEATEWFDLLSRAYCSFTLCDASGHVIGCVDVRSPRGISRSHRQLKQTLLAQCGIGYWVLAPDLLPEPSVLRLEFLGAAAASEPPPRPSGLAELETARHQLHETLERKRSHRHPHEAAADHQELEHAPWPQADSFLASLDSRRAPLQ